MILGNVKVAVPPDDNPDHGGGPIRVSPNNALPAHAGNTVYRSPNTITRDPEPGARWPGDLSKMMFLPDGRLVPAKPYAYDMFRGAPDVIYAQPVSRSMSSGLRTIVPAVAMFTGAAVGYKISSRHQGWGAIGGAVVGGVLGLIFR